VLLPRYVAGDHERIRSATLPHLPGRCFGFVLMQVGNPDARAFTAETLRRRQADATGAAGYNYDSIRKSH